MSVVSMIAAERDRYVAYFEKLSEEIKSSGKPFARELLISLNNEALTYPYRYIRADFITKNPDGADQVFEAWLDPAEDAEARGFQLGPVGIEIYPFTWCAAQIAFDRPLPNVDQLEALLTRWLDVSDLAASLSGAANSIHSVTPIESNGQLWYLTIDFGSSPADTLLDLIDFLMNEGMVTRIIITSQAR